MLPQSHTQMHVYLLTRREKHTPSHAESRDCVSASGVLPKGGGVKKFRWGRGPQVPSLKPGGGVEREKNQGEASGCIRKKERRRREGGSQQNPFLWSVILL